jgi:hypothetical protein
VRAPGHRLPADVVQEELALRLPVTEPIDRLFQTVVAWARYAELFNYNASADEIYLDDAELATAACPTAACPTDPDAAPGAQS